MGRLDSQSRGKPGYMTNDSHWPEPASERREKRRRRERERGWGIEKRQKKRREPNKWQVPDTRDPRSHLCLYNWVGSKLLQCESLSLSPGQLLLQLQLLLHESATINVLVYLCLGHTQFESGKCTAEGPDCQFSGSGEVRGGNSSYSPCNYK